MGLVGLVFHRSRWYHRQYYTVFNCQVHSMSRKKLSEMSPIERSDRILQGLSWDEAEEVGTEILARCVALHVYARKDGDEYIMPLFERIVKRADEWAAKNSWRLACAAVAHKREKEE